MPTSARHKQAWIVAVIIGFSALVVVPVWLYQSGIYPDNELVDEHGSVVGRGYLSGSSLHAKRYHDAAKLLATGENARAEQIYRELVDLEPHRPDVYIGLAGAQLRQRDLDGARKNYAAALELDHTNSQALYGAGAVERMAGNPQKAKTYYQKSLFQSPDHVLSHYGMAKVCTELGEKQTAKKHAKRFLELSPDSSLKKEISEILNAPDS